VGGPRRLRGAAGRAGPPGRPASLPASGQEEGGGEKEDEAAHLPSMAAGRRG